MPSVATSVRSVHGDGQVERCQNDDEEDDEGHIAVMNAMSIQVETTNGTSTTSPPKSNVARFNTSMLAPGSTINGTSAAKNDQSSRNSNDSTPSSKSTSLRNLLGVPPSVRVSGGNSLSVPPSTTSLTAPVGIGGASGLRMDSSTNEYGQETLPSEIAPKRKKVILGPGCSALDWARLKSQIPSKGFRKVKPSELKQHKSKDDAWSAFNGKVYDLTPYLKFHPGGVDELMRVAGRDGTRLFMLTHSWVNIDSMIDSCIIGILVPENST